MKLIVIGGYARSGKSTTMEYLAQYMPTASTSQVIHSFTYNYLLAQGFSSLGALRIMNDAAKRRPYKIKMAEEIVVPSIGRQGLVKLAFDSLSANYSVAAFESIGGEEYRCLQDLCFGSCVELVPVNIRSHSELLGVDIRELLPGAATITNNGSKQELFGELDELMKFFQNPG